MAIEWTPDLAVGVEEIDNQHKELFKRVDSLLVAMRDGKGKDEIGTIVTFLQDYVVTHFGAEEAYMARYFYPGQVQHKAEHTRFVKDFLDLKSSLEAGGSGSTFIVMINRQVGDWLRSHIGKTDKALGEFLRLKLAA